MIDFHSHILPNLDDGAGSLAESLAMLQQSFQQDVDIMVSTSHFYADREYPREFLRKRKEAFQRLQNAMLMSTEAYPEVILGAEVLYFPGISEAEDIAEMNIGNTRCILVEPPMAAWSDEMLNEIAHMRKSFDCIPVIAHVDRFMYYLNDYTLIERVRERDMVVQVNTECLLNPKTVKAAVKNLKNGNIQVIGSDCHNLGARSPNVGLALRKARSLGVEKEFRKLHQNAHILLSGGELL